MITSLERENPEKLNTYDLKICFTTFSYSLDQKSLNDECKSFRVNIHTVKPIIVTVITTNS